MHKLPHLFDLVTSFRRQRMLVTSTLTRTYLHWVNTPAYPYIPANEIKLLHPNSLEDTKTRRRYETILQHLRTSKTTTLSATDIGNLIPSDEEIQVAKIGGNSYISLQGVGRIVALKEAGKKAKIGLSIQVATYNLSNFPIIPGQLDGISDSYNIDEGLISRAMGVLLSAGSVYLGYLAAGKTMTFASSLASAVYDMMTQEVSQRNVETPPFEHQYPRGGTLTE